MRKRVKNHKNSIYEGIKSAGAEKAIALSCTLPADYNPVRYRTQFTAEPTVPVHVKKNHALDWAPPDGAATQRIPNNQNALFLFRDPLRAYIYDIKNPGRIAAVYRWAQALRQTTGPDLDFECPFSETTALEPIMALGNPITATNAQYHGPAIYAGLDKEGGRYIWTDFEAGGAGAGAVDVYSTGGLVLGDSVEVSLWRYNRGTPTLVQNALVAGPIAVGAVIFAFGGIGISDYYKVKVNFVASAGANSTSVQVTSVCNGEIFAHNPLPGLFENAQSVGEMVLSGASCLVKNQSAVMVKDGRLVFNQLPKGECWDNVINATPDPFSYLIQLQRSKDFNLETGGYAFLKAHEDGDMRMREPMIQNNEGDITDASFLLYDETFVACVMQVPFNSSAAPGIASDRNIFLSFYYNGEYTSKNDWLESEIAVTAPEAWSAAMMAIASMEQFYENPIHWGKILQSIGKYAGIVSGVARLFA